MLSDFARLPRPPYAIFTGCGSLNLSIFGATFLEAAADGSNVVEKKADGTFGNPAKEVPEDTKPADPVPTGDSALIFAVVAIISILGVATVAKRREN